MGGKRRGSGCYVASKEKAPDGSVTTRSQDSINDAEINERDVDKSVGGNKRRTYSFSAF